MFIASPAADGYCLRAAVRLRRCRLTAAALLCCKHQLPGKPAFPLLGCGALLLVLSKHKLFVSHAAGLLSIARELAAAAGSHP